MMFIIQQKQEIEGREARSKFKWLWRSYLPR